MRRRDHIVEAYQRIALRQRLDLEDIEARASDSAIAQGCHQGTLIDQFAAANVDKVRSGLHQDQLGRTNQPASVGGQSAV